MEAAKGNGMKARRRSRNGPLRAFAEYVAICVAARITPMLDTPVSVGEGEISHLIRVIEELERIRDGIESIRGFSKRQLRRWRPQLRQLTLLIERNRARLEALGVHRIEIGEFVDLERHDIACDVPTTRKSDDRRIVDVLKHGYADDERAIRRPLVSVARYQPASDLIEKKGV